MTERVAAETTLPAERPGIRASPAQLFEVDPERYGDRVAMSVGGMGQITSAFDLRLRRRVAIKEMRNHTAELRTRFEREALLTSRLQHPSIVQVQDAGRWPSGEPFYAMQLVRGRPLDQVVREAETLETRLGLLPHVLAIADAMAYAHEEGVIHRDLKPQNVLVGRFGETVVIDWGLAKDLAAEGRSSDEDPGELGDGELPSYSSSSSPALTEVGQVLGTPHFMAPEQALSRRTDQRADVYAIGAILYFVLSGRPPYDEGGMAVVERVRQQPPTPIRQLEPQSPLDLMAIVERAMARDPADRYRTAGELADDLRRFQTGQLVAAHHYSWSQLLRRWLRRYRAAVSVGAAATLLMVVLGALAIDELVERRDLAERRGAEAEALMDYMLFDLREKLEPLGRSELLGGIAARAQEYYASRQADGADDLRRHARTQQSIGEIQLARGNVDQALAAFQVATDAEHRRAILEPGNGAILMNLAGLHGQVARLLDMQGDLPASDRELGIALGLVACTAASSTSTEWLQHAYAISTFFAEALSDVGGTGDVSHFQSAVALGRRLRESADADLLKRIDVTAASTALARALMNLGKFDDALSTIDDAISYLEAIARTGIAVPKQQQQLAWLHRQRASILTTRGESPAALTSLRAGQSIMQRLVSHDPANVTWQSDLDRITSDIGTALQDEGRLQEAREVAQAALVHHEAILTKAPSNTHQAVRVAGLHRVVGSIQSELGDHAAAAKHYQAELDLQAPLAARIPAGPHRHYLAIAHQDLADVSRRAGDLDAALRHARAAQTIQEDLIADRPRYWHFQIASAATRSLLGDIRLAANDRQRALTEYQASLQILQQSAIEPSNLHAQFELARQHGKMGDAFLAARDLPAAMASYRANVAATALVLARAPTSMHYRLEAARGHARLGRLFLEQQGVGDAYRQLRIAATEMERVAAQTGSADAKQEAEDVQRTLAMCCAAVGEIRRPDRTATLIQIPDP